MNKKKDDCCIICGTLKASDDLQLKVVICDKCYMKALKLGVKKLMGK